MENLERPKFSIAEGRPEYQRSKSAAWSEMLLDPQRVKEEGKELLKAIGEVI